MCDNTEEFERDKIVVYFTCANEISGRIHQVCFNPNVSDKEIKEILEDNFGTEINIIGIETF